ncbi:monofunctional biosynthetic peptidoglycan transglycosylase [Erythrobacter sp. YJ-T3-07]|uniref:monofunctional biosynthetic peptidoglycan transglycosylase n=1 Tax=Erythrobacter sp. YJ-T3-07 TaxID=2793063 RepID=UPI0018D37C57|nr:monofunctional biosynthetic peptidoglycan transglycosylase [Erythrobacter sp. YJ-T3-07]
MFFRAFQILTALIATFIGLSLFLTLAFRFVPVPVTWTMILDENGYTKDWRSLDDIDRSLVRAVIASEDQNFCEHNGFDYAALQAAMENNMKGGKLRGGSTISQQTAKNAFLWQGGGFFRKGLEAYFTVLIENLWTKRRIMEVYLNVAETGIGTYGAQAGSLRYFGHGADRLSNSEAARMAVALPSPKKREVKNPQGWLRRHGDRTARAIGTMAREGLDACVYQ